MEGFALPEAPRFPKSLYLIQPLFSVYELNPVAAHAQVSIAVPDDLDLDTWIVPPPREVILASNGDINEKKKHIKKGKGKEVSSSATGKKKIPRNGEQTVLTAVDSDYETPEEKVQREKVKSKPLSWIARAYFTYFSAKQSGLHNYETILITSWTIDRKVSKTWTLYQSFI